MEVTRQEVAYFSLVNEEITTFVAILAKLLKPKAGFIKLELTDDEKAFIAELYGQFADPDELRSVQAVTAEMSAVKEG